MPKVITVGNEKGGTGKSTITANLAVEAVKDGFKVLLIDADVQQSSIDFRSVRADKDLPQFQAVSITKNTIHKDIQSFRDFDLIFIDAGGRDTATFRSALLAAGGGNGNLLLIPVLPSQYDVWSTETTIEALNEARTFIDINAHIVLNRVIPNTTIAKEALEALQQFSIPLVETRLCNRTAYGQSISAGKGVTEHEPTGKAASEIKTLYEEVKRLCQ